MATNVDNYLTDYSINFENYLIKVSLNYCGNKANTILEHTHTVHVGTI